MKETDKAWLAGFIDGEGCISLQRRCNHGKQYYGIRIQINQTQESVLRHVAKITGVDRVTFCPKPEDNKADQWKWDSDMRDSIQILSEVLPFLVRKREVAILALEFAEFWYGNRPPKKKIGETIQHTDYSKFEEYKDRFHKLNARGKGAA